MKRKLTEEQQKIVEELNRRYLVINAGPGTGKTTTAIERIKFLIRRGERVIYFCYERTIVTDCYQRVRDNPEIQKDHITTDCSTLQSHQRKKFLSVDAYFTTIDSFVARYIAKKQFMKQEQQEQDEEATAKNYDQHIEAFLKELTNTESFEEFKTTFSCFHIIIDEAQNIDDLRFEVIRKLEDVAKSVFIFGDPRQRLKEEAGCYFRKLWTDHSENNKYERRFLSETFRFKNENLLKFLNWFSGTKPETHVELKNSKQDFYDPDKVWILELREPILCVLETLCPILEKFRNKRVLFVSASLRSESKTSRFMAEIQSQVLDKFPNVQVYTFDSSKGLESDIVFVFGLEIISLVLTGDILFSKIFTAISRAREKLFLVVRVNEKSKLPKIYHNRLSLNEEGFPKKALKYVEPYNPDSQILEKICRNRSFCGFFFQKFSITGILNSFPKTAEKIFEKDLVSFIKCEKFSEFKVSEDLFESNQIFLGEFYGLLLGQLLAEELIDDFKKFTNACIAEEHIEKPRFYKCPSGICCYNPGPKEARYIEEEIVQLRNITKKDFSQIDLKDFHEIYEVFQHLHSETGCRNVVKRKGNFDSRSKKVLEELKDTSEKIKKLILSEQDSKIRLEKSVNIFRAYYKIITGRADVWTKDSILEIKYCKNNLFIYKIQTLFYMLAEKKPKGYLINLRDGKFVELKLGEKEMERVAKLFRELIREVIKKVHNDIEEFDDEEDDIEDLY
jgi:superfamily I DNA/RNA helicase